jgi:ribosome biogenesis GTPase
LVTPSLDDLGWTEERASSLALDPRASERHPARVASVYAARVEVWTAHEPRPRLASLRSRALRMASVEGGIAVGDWVLVAPTFEGEVVVEDILPRRTVFLRQAAGERAEPQAIAANIDRVFVVTAVDGDFNVRRLERYLVAIAAGGAEAQLVLTKIDLVDDAAGSERVRIASALAPVIATSARTGAGIAELASRIPRASTAALVGSSGVGKSALLNRLVGHDAQREGAVRAYDGKGRHTTTKRQLFALPGGGLLIDTPGMRELTPWLPAGGARANADADANASANLGRSEAFADLEALAAACRYRDCRHGGEPDCAVKAALERGEVSADRALAWQKLAQQRTELAPRQLAAATQAAKRHARSLSVALRRRLREKA